MVSVLVVDDEELSRIAVKKMLSRLFPEASVVGEAVNGRIAVEMATDLDPDIVIMDIRIPVLNGLDATSRILEAKPSVRVIMLSAFDSFGFAQRAINIGASGYILKPLREEDFRQVFSRTIASRAGDPGATAAGLAAPGKSMRLRIERAIESCAYGELGLEAVAQKIGTSPQHLSRIFKELFGLKFVEYITGRRLDEAMEILRREELTVEDLCRRIGWTDSAHFTRLFKEKTGSTPKLWARSVREGQAIPVQAFARDAGEIEY